jgi:hypothetical protein
MNRTTLAAIILVSALATPVVVNATAQKADPASVETIAAAQKAQEPTCVRQIRVVYAGYGEGQATPCITPIR